MAKKYKGVLKQERELFKKTYEMVHKPNQTNKENIQSTIDYLGHTLGTYINTDKQKNASSAAVGLKALIDDMNGQLVHYFINDKSLLEFLKNTEIKDTSIVSEYIMENKSKLMLFKDEGYYSVALHSEDEAFVFTYIQNKTKTVIVVNDSEYTYDFTLGNKIELPGSRVAINFIYYLKAYPEKILDGVPQDMVKNDKKNFNHSMCHSIGIADEIVEKTEVVNGHIVSPHFRSGFFRHYTDDRYVNMKGKVQFIAATMVKGKAKTVVA